MKLRTAVIASTLLASARAHVAFTNFFINGKDQGSGVGIRMRNDPSKATFPLTDLTSPDMACNVDGDKGVDRTILASAGDEFTFNFRATPDGSKAGTIDVSHKGPCSVYMKKVDSPTDAGSGDGWFKVWQDGYDSSTQQWCVDKLIANNGLISVNLPTDLAQGYYLVRPEILALHAAASQHQPQYYTGCAQIYLKSSGTATPPTVSIPGYVSLDDKSDSFNIWDQPMKLPYPIPGPAPYVSAGSKRLTRRADPVPSNIQGLKTADCICQNGNWCGTEVAPSSDEASCWKTGEACWAQSKACYDAASPAGNAGCKAWEQKCQAINDGCNARQFNQPTNPGKNITPDSIFMSVSCPAPYTGVGTAAGGGTDHTGSAGSSYSGSAAGSASSGSSTTGGSSSSSASSAASSAASSSYAYAPYPISNATSVAAYVKPASSATDDQPTTTSTTFADTMTVTATRSVSDTAVTATATDAASANPDDEDCPDDETSDGKAADDQQQQNTPASAATAAAASTAVPLEQSHGIGTGASGPAGAKSGTDQAQGQNCGGVVYITQTITQFTAATSTATDVSGSDVTSTITATVTATAATPMKERMLRRHLDRHRLGHTLE